MSLDSTQDVVSSVKDTLENAARTVNKVSEDEFATQLIWSEIIITAILMVGMYFIFKNMFKDKESSSIPLGDD